MNGEAHFDLNILGVPDYLKWVDSQLRDLTISNATEIIQTNHQDASAYAVRARAYLEKNDFTNAVSDFKSALALKLDDSDLLNGFAWLLATCPVDSIRDGKQAVDLATKACGLTEWKQWQCVGTLAAAYAEVGDFEHALLYQKQSMELLGQSAKEREDQKRRLMLFEQHKPAHESSE